MKSIYTFCLCLFSMLLSFQAYTQIEFDPTNEDLIIKERSLNITTLVTQFVPLGRASFRAGPITFNGTRIRAGKLSRFGIGLNIDINNETLTHFNIRYGWGKEIHLEKRWSYYRGVDIWFFGGSFNVPFEAENNPFFNNGFNVGFGPAPFIGIKYHLSPRVNLGTETNIFIGVVTESVIGFQIIPPVSLNLSIRMFKER